MTLYFNNNFVINYNNQGYKMRYNAYYKELIIDDGCNTPYVKYLTPTNYKNVIENLITEWQYTSYELQQKDKEFFQEIENSFK